MAVGGFTSPSVSSSGTRTKIGKVNRPKRTASGQSVPGSIGSQEHDPQRHGSSSIPKRQGKGLGLKSRSHKFHS